MNDSKPHPKVVAGTTAGALSIVLVWTLAQAGIDMPNEVAQALTVLIGAIAAYMKAS